MAAEPFEVSITEAEIADLRERLRRTRWPEPEPVDDWSQGLPLAYAQELCRSWAEDYDFGFAKRLNVFPQYRDTVEGLGIHFLHVRSPEPDAFPLVLTHGWPGSVLEFLEVLGPLTDPRAHGGDSADAFHVVAPSLPGYGVVEVHGEVYGLIVRAPNVFSNIGAGFRTVVGGEAKGYTKLLSESRDHATERLREAAAAKGANAVLAMRFDCNEIGDIMSEVAAYGTAVTVRPRA